MSRLDFVKMHGLGNDYVMVVDFEHRVRQPDLLARAMSCRRRGIGADGLILVEPSNALHGRVQSAGQPTHAEPADLEMRVFNADGSEAEMCGNGIRCLCKLAHDDAICLAHPMRVRTRAGVLTLTYTTDHEDRIDQVTVDMGPPTLDWSLLPVRPGRLDHAAEPIAGVEVGDQRIDMMLVSMGNPHAVIFVERLESIELQTLGSAIERHDAFPGRINAHFAAVKGPNDVVIRSWERGSGATLACGTGAAAVCVAAALTEQTSRDIVAHLPGGDLSMRWDQSTGHVFMTGPATETFRGSWPAPS